MNQGYKCPICGKSSRLVSVSDVYFELVSNHAIGEIGNGILIPFPETQEKNQKSIPHTRMEFLQKFAPPNTPRTPFMMTIRPDQFAILFLLVGIYAVYYFWSIQPGSFIPAAAVLLLCSAVYFGFRKKILESYLVKKSALDKRTADLIKLVDIWNRLIYCAQDGIVLDPATGTQIQPGEMLSYLEKNKDQV
jgi:hypothetical protein